MKFAIKVGLLTVIIIGLFVYAIYVSIKLEETNTQLNETLKKYNDAGLTIEFLENENSKKTIEYARLLNEGTQSKWEIASDINTLSAYSTFVENCNDEDEDCHQAELENAINSLLNGEGYVQMVERNGNKLYKEMKLNLDGEFVKFQEAKNARNGAFGINDCGNANPTKVGIISKGKIVKVLEKCQASGSKSIWAKVQYSN